MKINKQKGFIVPLLIGIIAVLIIGGGAYIYSNKKVAEAPVVIDSNLPGHASTTNLNSEQIQLRSEGKPVITFISSTSGAIGTKVELKGYNLVDARGDQNIIIENSNRETGSFGFGEVSHLDLSQKYAGIKFTLAAKVCNQLATDAGLPCKTWMNIIPGEYKIYVGNIRGGTNEEVFKSNTVPFTVTNTAVVDEIKDWKTYTNTQYGFSLKYPDDFVTVINEASLPDLYLEIHPKVMPIEFGPNLLVTVSKTNNIGLDKYITDFFSSNSIILSQEVKNINNIDWIKIRSRQIDPVGPDVVFSDYFYVKDGYIYQFDLTEDDQETRELFDKILSTIKFIN